MPKTLFALAALTLAPALAAQMNPSPTPDRTQTRPAPTTAVDAPPGRFARLDANRDGSVSRAEAFADAGLVARFGPLDRDGSGRLDAQELASAPATASPR